MYKKTIEKFIKGVDKNIKVIFPEELCGLSCEPTEDNIYVGFRYREVETKSFLDYINELDKTFLHTYKIDQFILGILHEIGHIMTHNDEMEEDYNLCTNLLNLAYENGRISEKQINDFYVRLDLETYATQWAIDFVKSNYDYVNKFQKRIGTLVNVKFNLLNKDETYLRVTY